MLRTLAEKLRWVHLLRWILAACMTIGSVTSALAHEIRPAYLEIRERADQRYDFLWKRPSVEGLPLSLVPRISGGLLDRAATTSYDTSSFQISLWRDIAAGPDGLAGRTLQLDGLEHTMTTVLVSLVHADGRVERHVLTSERPSTTLAPSPASSGLLAYVKLGIQHIFAGADHLLFVLGLAILARSLTRLVQAITAFTLAHSITLITTALGFTVVRPSLIEVLVALSTLFVAVECVHATQGRQGLSARYPWLVAFAFGLLHGSAFAGALVQIGLPANAIVTSLLMFNLGVELGQFAFLALALGVSAVFVRWSARSEHLGRRALPYAIGTCSAFWLLDRLTLVLH